MAKLRWLSEDEAELLGAMALVASAVALLAMTLA